MLGVTDLWTYVLGTVAIILLPGPNSLLTLSVATRRGVRAGYRAAAGVFVGDSVLMALSAAGVASILRAYPPVFVVIKYAGAVYLAYIGGGMLLGVLRRWRAPAQPPSEVDTAPAPAEPELSGGRVFRRSLLISLLNPKAILFFVSFFVQFVDPTYAYPALTFLVLAAIVQICSLLYLTTLIFGGARLAAAMRRRRRLGAAARTGIGALFIGFGVKLATATI